MNSCVGLGDQPRRSGPSSAPHQLLHPHQTPPPQQHEQPISLNSRRYTNRVSLLLFLLHFATASFAVGFFAFKAAQGLARVGTRSATWRESRVCALAFPCRGLGSTQRAPRLRVAEGRPRLAGLHDPLHPLARILDHNVREGAPPLPFPPTAAAVGAALVAFSFDTWMYSCRVTRRAKFTASVFAEALRPVGKFEGLNGPAYAMMLPHRRRRTELRLPGTDGVRAGAEPGVGRGGDEERGHPCNIQFMHSMHSFSLSYSI